MIFTIKNVHQEVDFNQFPELFLNLRACRFHAHLN